MRGTKKWAREVKEGGGDRGRMEYLNAEQGRKASNN